MRKRTIRSGLRLLSLSIILLLLGTFYGEQINTLLAVAGDGTAEFVRLAFLWGAVLGAAAILMISFGLLQRSLPGEKKIRLLPSLIFLVILLTIFFALFYRFVSAPPQEKPLRPGETLVI